MTFDKPALESTRAARRYKNSVDRSENSYSIIKNKKIKKTLGGLEDTAAGASRGWKRSCIIKTSLFFPFFFTGTRTVAFLHLE